MLLNVPITAAEDNTMHFGNRRNLRSAPEAGLSLVETLVAIILFGLVAAAAASMLISGVQSSDGQRARAEAASVAASQLEVDRHTSVAAFTTLTPPGTATFNYTVAGRSFTATRLTEWVPKVDAANACDSAADGQGGNNGVQPVLEVTESVSWQHMAGASPVVNQTTITPPVGTYASTSGAIDVGVDDSNNQPVANLPVVFKDTTANTSQTITTDSRGCAFAAFLTAGHQFNVTVSKAGYVDNNENTTGLSTCESGGTVAVTSGNVVSCPFLYDQGVTVNWQYAPGCYVGPGTGTPALTAAQCPLPTELQSSPVVAVGNAGLSASQQFAGTFTPVASGTTLLYPYSSYTMWAGHCSLSKPVSPPTSFTAQPSPVTPNPVVVPLYGLGLQLKSNTSGGPYVVTGVTAKEAGTGNNCYPTAAGARTYTLQTPTVTTTATTTYNALPVGTYTVTVNYTKNGTAQSPKTATVTVGYNTGSPATTGGTTSLVTLS